MKQDLGLPYSQETQRFREREVDKTWMQEGVPGTGDAERNSHGAAVWQDPAECLTCRNSSVHKAHVQCGRCSPCFTAEEIKAQTDYEP